MTTSECRQMFTLVKDLHTTVCGDKEMRIPGLIQRVEKVEDKVAIARYVGVALICLAVGAAYGLKGGVEKIIDMVIK